MTLDVQLITLKTSTELQLEWFNRVQTVGVTAGASTPDWIIEGGH